MNERAKSEFQNPNSKIEMWEGYKRRPRGYQKRVLEPYVSITRRGEIVLNRSALELIGGAINVILFFDAETKRIGIRGATQADLGYKVFCARRHGRGGRSRSIRARRFLKQFGIAITETLVFRPSQVEPGEMLVLDLDKKSSPPCLGGVAFGSQYDPNDGVVAKAVS